LYLQELLTNVKEMGKERAGEAKDWKTKEEEMDLGRT
jgi:hypothetical protein